ncbi:MAG: DUF695 domain-containing protein [Sulfurimonas sp.]|nr:DUF695 domain-containing protein [Sulfurimonas sp.]
MREVFQRVESDRSVINIEVDVDALEFKDESPWLFSVFIKYDASDENLDGFEEFLETKESLIIALAYEDRARYVGSRVVDGWSELYFYAPFSKELDSMVSAILKPTNYIFESNVVRDTKWGFYFSQLSPTELEYHHILSAKIINQLQEEGDNLEISRIVEHYVSFETPTQKNRFINTLELNGFSFKDDIATDEFEHGLALVKKHPISYNEVKKVVDELFIEIKKENGYYEGWSTTLMDENTI